MEPTKTFRKIDFRSIKDIKNTKCPICSDTMGEHSEKNMLRHWDFMNTVSTRAIQENNAMKMYLETLKQKEPITIPTSHPQPETTPIEKDENKVI